jgi:hypothetical protein
MEPIPKAEFSIVTRTSAKAWLPELIASAGPEVYREAFVTGFSADEWEQAGEEPQLSPWDGRIDVVDRYIKGRINDPGSYRFVSSWKPQLTKVDGQWSWKVKYIYRAKNPFGGVITYTAFVTIRHGKVVDVTVE